MTTDYNYNVNSDVLSSLQEIHNSIQYEINLVYVFGVIALIIFFTYLMYKFLDYFV